MKVKCFENGVAAENTYLCIKDNKAVIIDPGMPIGDLDDYVKFNNIEVVGILLTHGHFDHIGGCDYYHDKYQVDIYMNEDDEVCLMDGMYNLASDALVTSKPQFYEETLNLGDFNFKFISAPGHSMGSTLIIVDDEIMFSGDVLFKNSIGRTDFRGSDSKLMEETLEMLKQLKTNYHVFPGHGLDTYLFNELKNNVYLK